MSTDLIITPCPGCGERHAPAVPCADGTWWWHGPTVCRICGSRHSSVVPVPRGLDVHDLTILCGDCGHPTREPAANVEVP